MSAASFQDPRIAALKAEIAAIEHSRRAGGGSVLRFGIDEIDERLASGGLATGLHEAASASPTPNDEAAATLFLASVAGRFSRHGGGRSQVLWALTRRDLFAPALAQAGLTPDRILYAECGNDEEALAVMEEGIRHGSLAAVVGEVGRASMPATRRLQLAAEEGGTAALLRRRWQKKEADPLAVPSASLTRWRIACAASAPLPFAAMGPFEGIGRACWEVALVRQRGGPPHIWYLEAPDAEACLALSARSGDRPDQAGRAPKIAA
ncbi:MAG TPA: protein ImuA [Allosphingosinicella sp.]|nr:protein ImuA [Allosphingosinicella sp.]